MCAVLDKIFPTVARCYLAWYADRGFNPNSCLEFIAVTIVNYLAAIHFYIKPLERLSGQVASRAVGLTG